MTAGVFLFCHDVLMRIEYIKERIESVSCPRLSGSKRTTFRGAELRCKSEWDALPLAKVSAELTKRASASRAVKRFYTERYYLLACHSWTKWRIWQRIQVLHILTCVRKHAPFASQSSALPSASGGSKRLRKKEIIFFIFKYAFDDILCWILR